MSDESDEDTFLRESVYVVLAWSSFMIAPVTVWFWLVLPRVGGEHALFVAMGSLVALFAIGSGFTTFFMRKARTLKYGAPYR